MTRPNIDEIRARVEATTPGKWYVHYGAVETDTGVGGGHGYGTIFHDEGHCDADVVFAAHAHQDIPALLAYIEELEGEIRGKDDHQTSTIQNLIASMNKILEAEDGTTPPSKGARAAVENILNVLKGDGR